MGYSEFSSRLPPIFRPLSPEEQAVKATASQRKGATKKLQQEVNNHYKSVISAQRDMQKQIAALHANPKLATDMKTKNDFSQFQQRSFRKITHLNQESARQIAAMAEADLSPKDAAKLLQIVYELQILQQQHDALQTLAQPSEVPRKLKGADASGAKLRLVDIPKEEKAQAKRQLIAQGKALDQLLSKIDKAAKDLHKDINNTLSHPQSLNQARSKDLDERIQACVDHLQRHLSDLRQTEPYWDAEMRQQYHLHADRARVKLLELKAQKVALHQVFHDPVKTVLCASDAVRAALTGINAKNASQKLSEALVQWKEAQSKIGEIKGNTLSDQLAIQSFQAAEQELRRLEATYTTFKAGSSQEEMMDSLDRGTYSSLSSATEVLSLQLVHIHWLAGHPGASVEERVVTFRDNLFNLRPDDLVKLMQNKEFRTLLDNINRDYPGNQISAIADVLVPLTEMHVAVQKLSAKKATIEQFQAIAQIREKMERAVGTLFEDSRNAIQRKVEAANAEFDAVIAESCRGHVKSLNTVWPANTPAKKIGLLWPQLHPHVSFLKQATALSRAGDNAQIRDAEIRTWETRVRDSLRGIVYPNIEAALMAGGAQAQSLTVKDVPAIKELLAARIAELALVDEAERPAMMRSIEGMLAQREFLSPKVKAALNKDREFKAVLTSFASTYKVDRDAHLLFERLAEFASRVERLIGQPNHAIRSNIDNIRGHLDSMERAMHGADGAVAAKVKQNPDFGRVMNLYQRAKAAIGEDAESTKAFSPVRNALNQMRTLLDSGNLAGASAQRWSAEGELRQMPSSALKLGLGEELTALKQRFHVRRLAEAVKPNSHLSTEELYETFIFFVEQSRSGDPNEKVLARQAYIQLAEARGGFAKFIVPIFNHGQTYHVEHAEKNYFQDVLTEFPKAMHRKALKSLTSALQNLGRRDLASAMNQLAAAQQTYSTLEHTTYYPKIKEALESAHKALRDKLAMTNKELQLQQAIVGGAKPNDLRATARMLTRLLLSSRYEHMQTGKLPEGFDHVFGGLDEVTRSKMLKYKAFAQEYRDYLNLKIRSLIATAPAGDVRAHTRAKAYLHEFKKVASTGDANRLGYLVNEKWQGATPSAGKLKFTQDEMDLVSELRTRANEKTVAVLKGEGPELLASVFSKVLQRAVHLRAKGDREGIRRALNEVEKLADFVKAGTLSEETVRKMLEAHPEIQASFATLMTSLYDDARTASKKGDHKAFEKSKAAMFKVKELFPSEVVLDIRGRYSEMSGAEEAFNRATWRLERVEEEFEEPPVELAEVPFEERPRAIDFNELAENLRQAMEPIQQLAHINSVLDSLRFEPPEGNARLQLAQQLRPLIDVSMTDSDYAKLSSMVFGGSNDTSENIAYVLSKLAVSRRLSDGEAGSPFGLDNYWRTLTQQQQEEIRQMPEAYGILENYIYGAR